MWIWFLGGWSSQVRCVLDTRCFLPINEIESSRSKNTVNILIKNWLDMCLGAIVYWALGFGLTWGEDVAGIRCFTESDMTYDVVSNCIILVEALTSLASQCRPICCPSSSSSSRSRPQPRPWWAAPWRSAATSWRTWCTAASSPGSSTPCWLTGAGTNTAGCTN